MICSFTYKHTHTHTFVYIYIYIYAERERQTDRQTEIDSLITLVKERKNLDPRDK